MEVHRQHCQTCDTFETRNIVVRKPNQPLTVYVRCSNCKGLIARYRLQEYYHHGKSAESFFRSRGAVAVESGRRMLNEFKQAEDESLEGFEEAVAYLLEHGKQI